MRNRAVSEMMSSRCTVVKLSGTRATPLPVSPPSFVIVFSISAGSCTSAMIGCTLYFAAASMNAPAKKVPASGTESGLYIRATRASCGTMSFNIETYFPAMLACRMVNPVMFPPGRAMLATNPPPIGSETDTKTMGNCASRMHQRRHNGRAVANDAAGIEFHQLLCKSLHARRIAFGIAVLDAKVLAEGPALRFETLLESHQAASGFRIVGKPHQHRHGAYASCQLRICRDRLAHDCAAEQGNELAPPHRATPRPDIAG